MAYNDQEQPKTEVLTIRTQSVVDSNLVPHDLPEDQVYKPMHQRICGISFVRASILRGPAGEAYNVTKIGSIGGNMADEVDVLRSFWAAFNASRPRLSGAKLRYWILPQIVQRSMLHGIPMHGLFRAPSKWEGYNARFSTAWTCDLDDAMTLNGAGAHIKFEDMVAAMGLPMAPVRLTNTEIAEKVALGDTADLKASCEYEAISAFALYVRWMHVTGNATIQLHDDSMQSIVSYLEENRDTQPHLGAYLDQWRASRQPKPMMLGAAPTPAVSIPAATQ